MIKEKRLRRIFEIIPGLLTWTTLGALFVLAFMRPVWVAVFVIVFDLYWVIRIGYLTMLLVFAYRRLELEKNTDWLKRCESLGEVDGMRHNNIYHAVLFPAYKEGPEILMPSIQALENSNYPKDRMIVVISVEERAGSAAWENAIRFKEKYKDVFKQFIV
ncbi:MAG: hypothetical protein Q8N91_05200, partial [Candidatus Omnitrophota bacterium]|nr:hypothetical protein [Candidatus Omnitrophota bacterium]